MLVLKRKPNESIAIGDDILVKIVEVNHHGVKIGVTAPTTMFIRRTELDITPREHQSGIIRSQTQDANGCDWAVFDTIQRLIESGHVVVSGKGCCQLCDKRGVLVAQGDTFRQLCVNIVLAEL